MPTFAPIRLDDGSIIYMEVDDATSPLVVAPEATNPEIPREVTRGERGQAKGVIDDALRQFPLKSIQAQELAVQSFDAIENTIRAYTDHTMNAFKKVSANVTKVTLEFGIELGGEVGIPYVTKGTGKSNLKVTVECTFDKPKPEQNQQNPRPNLGGEG